MTNVSYKTNKVSHQDIILEKSISLTIKTVKTVNVKCYEPIHQILTKLKT